jgi:TPR repeat protein
MFCYKCGKEMSEDMAFCPKCGAKAAVVNENEERNRLSENDNNGYQELEEQGDAEAQKNYNLGMQYCFGRGFNPNYQEALYCFQKAAERGNAAAHFYLGRMYCLGEGVDKNYQKAFSWFQKAAELRNADAQFLVKTWTYWDWK